MTGDSFNALVWSQDPGLTVVTTAEAGERAGCLVSFHSQSSIGPQRYCVWLSKANHTYRVALRSTHLAVHFLTSSDLALAERFGSRTGDDGDKFGGLRVNLGPGGAVRTARYRARQRAVRTAPHVRGRPHRGRAPPLGTARSAH